jgi:hypothetical protein
LACFARVHFSRRAKTAPFASVSEFCAGRFAWRRANSFAMRGLELRVPPGEPIAPCKTLDFARRDRKLDQ